MRVVAYVRVSSAHQAEAYGPEVQRAAIAKWAKAKAAYDKAISARTDSVDPFYRRAVAEYELGDFQAALVRDLANLPGGQGLYILSSTITSPTLGRTLIQRADSQGHFFVQPFDKSINPKDVNITCLKDGYTVATASKTVPASPDTPVDAICVLHKQ